MATFYVEPQHLVADINAARYATGDTVLFRRGGVWLGTSLVMTQSGVAYGAFGEGARPVIHSENPSHAAAYSLAAELHDVAVRGLELRNGVGIGIFFIGLNCARIYLDDLEIDTGRVPVFIKSIDTFEVTRCRCSVSVNGGITVYGTPSYPACNGIIAHNIVDGRGTAGNDGIGIHENDGDLADVGDNFLVLGNIVHGFAEQAIDINSGNHVTLDGNTCYDNGDDGIILAGFHQTIRNNTVYGNGRDGIVIIGSAANPSGDVQCYGNLVYNNRRNDILVTGQVDGYGVYENTFFRQPGVTVGGGTTNGNIHGNIYEEAPMATKTINFTLEVTAPPDWFLSINPAALSVVQGDLAVFEVTASAEGGYAGQITLAVLGLPEGVEATITPGIIAQDGAAAVEIPTGNIPVGSAIALQLQGTTAD